MTGSDLRTQTQQIPDSPDGSRIDFKFPGSDLPVSDLPSGPIFFFCSGPFMTDPRVPLKNPAVAALLALLIPGAGHWYQGRKFKSSIYFSGILILFVWGMIAGQGQPVYSHLVQPRTPDSPQYERDKPAMSVSWGYGAQVLTGIPAWPAILQKIRSQQKDDSVNFLDHEIDAPFVGVIKQDDGRQTSRRAVTGQLRLQPVDQAGNRTVNGTLTYNDGTATVVQLGGLIKQGRQVFGSPLRMISVPIVYEDRHSGFDSIEGSIPRSFLNWFMAPRDTPELDRLHGSLGRQFDVASICTWIAGLLNLMAIWDAAQGPAYGYGDEKPDKDKKAAA